MKIKLIFLTIFMPLVLSAAGSFTLKGEVRNFDKKTFEINDSRHIYKISKEKIPHSYKEKILNIKSGMKLTLVIPFASILDVKKAK